MFVALYRWKLKEGQEQKFREGWRRRTSEIYRKCGSLGSRLHRAEDGTWVAYAQWPDKRKWEAARRVPVADTEASEMMKESVEVSYPEMLLEMSDDLLEPRGVSAPEE
ncbi:MAG TPA: antibiotic biosynthesis monooxygenase [Pyrinomonadaceae bacterium]|jgi:heme-degrading monooxygenase HmoA|nr:antibiotic biosynthesis monooxygenase [Pyrinomonadaceae bacterium]